MSVASGEQFPSLFLCALSITRTLSAAGITEYPISIRTLASSTGQASSPPQTLSPPMCFLDKNPQMTSERLDSHEASPLPPPLSPPPLPSLPPPPPFLLPL